MRTVRELYALFGHEAPALAVLLVVGLVLTPFIVAVLP